MAVSSGAIIGRVCSMKACRSVATPSTLAISWERMNALFRRQLTRSSWHHGCAVESSPLLLIIGIPSPSVRTEV